VTFTFLTSIGSSLSFRLRRLAEKGVVPSEGPGVGDEMGVNGVGGDLMGLSALPCAKTFSRFSVGVGLGVEVGAGTEEGESGVDGLKNDKEEAIGEPMPSASSGVLNRHNILFSSFKI